MQKKYKVMAALLAASVLLQVSPVQAADKLPTAYMNTLSQVTEKYPSTRTQGNYSACWAFTAVSLAEFDLIADDAVANPSIDLSELELAYQTCHPATDAFGGTKGDGLSYMTGYLDTGGNLNYSSRTLLQWRGLVSEETVPYSLAYSYQGGNAQEKEAAHLQNVYILKLKKEQSSVKKEIIRHGAAGIGLYFSNRAGFDQTAFYQGNVVSTYYCASENKAYTPNHTAVIVGWDDDFPADNFKEKPRKNGAWLVRNSWSDTSSNSISSYFWLSYEDKSLDENAWIMDFEPADNYDYIYQYDGCPVVGKVCSCTAAANVFQAKGAPVELLKAVSVTLNEDTLVPYTIKIYTNLSDPANPQSGILEASVSGKTSYAGTYTIPLSRPLCLQKGSRYGIVVELQKKNAGIDMEIAAKQYPLKSMAEIKKNQSFLYRNGIWKDVSVSSGMNNVGNLCIKGYTDQTKERAGSIQGFRAGSASGTAVKLSWSSRGDAQGYELYRADSKNGTYRKIATVKGKSYKNTGLKKGKTYYYKVRAYQKKNGVKITGKLSSAVKVTTKRG